MEYGKLVRDYIPQILRGQGRIPQTRHLGDEEYLLCLRLKLQEEVDEYLNSGDTQELCDIMEVVYALAQARGISPQGLQEQRMEKARERGGFDDRVYLERTL